MTLPSPTAFRLGSWQFLSSSIPVWFGTGFGEGIGVQKKNNLFLSSLERVQYENTESYVYCQLLKYN